MSNRLQIWLVSSKIVFLAILIINLFLPVKAGTESGLSPFSLLIIGFWVYGFLGSVGIIKKVVARNEDGTIEYKTSIPFVQVGITRVVEVVYYQVRFHEFYIREFIVLCIFDIVYTILLLMDKNSFYYESVSSEEEF